MAQINYLQTNFTAGEISPKLYGRVDIGRYKNGAKSLQNFITMIEGGARRRGGTKFMLACRETDTVPRLIRWQYSVDQVYVIEMTPNVFRFHVPGDGVLAETGKTITGATAASPCVITATAHGFANGDRVVITGVGGMSPLNNRHFEVANITANTFELLGINSTGYPAFTTGGTVARIVEVAHDYGANYATVETAQFGDALYLAHASFARQKLTRTSTTTCVLSDVEIERGPLRTLNSDDHEYISATQYYVYSLLLEEDGIDAFLLEDDSGRIILEDVQISAATQTKPCAITTTGSHNLTTGQTVTISGVSGMTQLNGVKFRIVVTGTNTLTLEDPRGYPIDATAYTAYVSGGMITATTTPFGTYSQGTRLSLTSTTGIFQAGHVDGLLRLWEPGQGSGVCAPFGTATLTDNIMYTYEGGVYGVHGLVSPSAKWQNDWHYPSHRSGTIRVINTTGTEYFDAVYLHDSSCVVQIDEWVSSTEVRGRIVHNDLPKSIIDAPTRYFEFGAWSAQYGYTALLTVDNRRMWSTKSSGNPQTVWASTLGNFERHQDGADDDDSISATYGSDQIETPVWMMPGSGVLAMGTENGEFVIRASNVSEAVTPSNIKIDKKGFAGSAPTRPVQIGESIVFVQRDGDPANFGRKVREITWLSDRDSFAPLDLTRLASHIGATATIRELAYQQVPDSILWARRSNGTLAGCTYVKEEEIIAWHQHTFENGTVQRMVVAPGPDGDELWLVVTRTISGETVRNLEVMQYGLDEAGAIEDSKFFDCHLQYSGTSTSTITGLWHLRGETLGCLINGAVVPDVTVDSLGRVTLPRAGTRVLIGYDIDARIETLDFEAGAQAGTAQGRPKRINELTLRFYRTGYAQYGRDASSLDEVQFRSTTDAMGSPVPLFSGLKRVSFDGGWDREASALIVASKGLPCTVLGVGPQLTTQG